MAPSRRHFQYHTPSNDFKRRQNLFHAIMYSSTFIALLDKKIHMLSFHHNLLFLNNKKKYNGVRSYY